jgi:hypothetical protein
MNTRLLAHPQVFSKVANWRFGAAAAAITAALLLSGCTPIAAASSAPKPAAVSSATSATVMDGHSQIALTCAAASILESTLYNARVDMERGAITPTQSAAIVNSTVINFRGLAQHPDWGLQDQARALSNFIESSSPLPTGALFDIYSNEWESQRQALNAECKQNDTEVAIMAATGG